VEIAARSAPAVAGYRHDALFHADERELLATAVPFVRAGLRAGDAVVLMCDEATACALADAVGGDKRLAHLPRAEAYRRTPAVIGGYRDLVQRAMAEGAGRMRLIGDVDLGIPADEAEWGRYEAVCNAALAALPLWSLCLYDTARLPAGVLAAGRSTHPHLVDSGGRAPNPDFVTPVDYLRRSAAMDAEPVEAGPADLHRERLVRHDLEVVRRAVHGLLSASAATPATVDGFVVAVSEIMSNALQHGRPPVTVDVWSTPDRSVCVVSDAGDGFDDPLAGYLTPDPPGADGLGLHAARHLCDRVSFERSGDRFEVRLAVGH
jgi:anti-sigma regulatory factor (Ser/Thr protein kinase)